MIAAFRYSTGFLQEAVREQGLLPLEEAVHKLTAAPARLYGVRDRGVLREGAHADVVVFDPATVGATEVGPASTCRAAGGLYADATGIHDVLVAGQQIAVDGEYTGVRPGRVLRSGADTATPTLEL